MTHINKVLWEEDECTYYDPDHERLTQAWLRLFGEELDVGDALADQDNGDCIMFYMPNGHVAGTAYCGGFIREYAPKELLEVGVSPTTLAARFHAALQVGTQGLKEPS